MAQEPIIFESLPGELWWGGGSHYGTMMPFGKTKTSINLLGDLGGNQGAPLFLSNRGRYLWSDDPFAITFDQGRISVSSAKGAVLLEEGHANLRGSYRHASQTFFATSGRRPPEAFFKTPQYNTWIEMGYEPTASKVIAYAHHILAHGFPAGVLMIDDNWQEDYGTWDFHPGRFPDPAAMVRELHALGFSVMLWMCPFISADSQTFRTLRGQGLLVKDGSGDAAIRAWWNGYSAVLDGSHPEAVSWLHERLQGLMDRYGIDGFKMDAGDPEYYRAEDSTYGQVTPVEQCRLWSNIGVAYPFNEFRASWRMGGQPLVQRLRDKRHSWDEDGLNTLIPNGLAQGLLGYAFNCPDMVGGGLEGDFGSPHFRFDQDLFIRYAQCSALFPMMQFSIAPWRVLDPDRLALCLNMVRLHVSMADELLALADAAASDGEPIMRHLSYAYPDQGYDEIRDQFMLGEGILVAPVLERGSERRRVAFPPGRWRGDDGSEVEGPTTVEVEAPLSRLPWYRLVHSSPLG